MASSTRSIHAAPVAISAGGVPPGLVTYGISWEFNGPLYEPLWRALEGLGLLPWSPLGGGWLTGKYRREVVAAAGSEVPTGATP
ncbi:MAG: hypothetical protein ACO3P9_12695, partial [Phycisphaerales bacterium]